MAMFKGRGKSLDSIGLLGWKRRIYTLFTPLEERIGNQDMEKGKIRLKNLKLMNASIKLRSKCMLLIFYAQSSGTFSFDKLFVSPI